MQRPLAACGALLLITLAGACGETERAVEASPDDTPAVTTGFTVTRADGSSFDVNGDAVVSCEPDEDIAGATLLRAFLPASDGAPGVGFLFEVDPTQVPEGGRDYVLPFRRDVDDPEAMVLFLVDPADGNEVSAAEEESSGTVSVAVATCDPRPRVALTAEVTLGSELSDLPAVDVVGGFDVTRQ